MAFYDHKPDEVPAGGYRTMALSHIRYELTFEERPGYLYARVAADGIDEETALAYLAEVAERCRDGGHERLMLHRDIPAMLPDTAMYFVASRFRELIERTRVAFVNPYESNRASFDFGVMIGTNRGASYGLFDNDTAAETWLLS